MSDVEFCKAHEPDYENYFYFAIYLITQIVPEPSPEMYLERLSRRIPEIEYLGSISHLNDIVQVRVKKEEQINVKGLKDGFASISGVRSVELRGQK